jgi:hypothetical protein
MFCVFSNIYKRVTDFTYLYSWSKNTYLTTVTLCITTGTIHCILETAYGHAKATATTQA